MKAIKAMKKTLVAIGAVALAMGAGTLRACECGFSWGSNYGSLYYNRTNEHCWTDPETGIRWMFWLENGEISLGNPYFNAMSRIDNDHQTAVSHYTVGKVVVPERLPVGGSNGTWYPVTAINRYAFFHCPKVTEIVIPDCVKEIGVGAFYECNGLRKLTLPFVGMKGSKNWGARYQFTLDTRYPDTPEDALEEIVISGVAKLPRSAFFGFSYLKKITFQEGVDSIPYCCCDGCKNLSEIVIPSSVTNIGNHAFSGTAIETVTVSKNVKKMEAVDLDTGSIGIFSDCKKLRRAVLEEGVTEVLDSMFSGCTNLTEVVIPSTVTNIGTYAFANCSNLEEIHLPAGLRFIGSGAFAGCNKLARTYFHNVRAWYDVYFQTASSNPLAMGGDLIVDGVAYRDLAVPEDASAVNVYHTVGVVDSGVVVLPPCARDIPDEAFKNCTWLKTITFPDAITNIGSCAFYNCNRLSSVTLPKSLQSIGSEAFAYCAKLPEVQMPSGVRQIGDSAFVRCSDLRKVVLSASLQTMGDGVFLCCSNITEATFADGARVVGPRAFAGCSLLERVTLPDSIEEIGDDAFTREAQEKVMSGYQVVAQYYYGPRLGSIAIPANLRCIGARAFYGQDAMAVDLNLPAALREIGESAFCGCTKVTGMTCAEGLTTVRSDAFENTAITNVVMPSTLRQLGAGAFENCKSLVAVDLSKAPIAEVPAWVCRLCTSLQRVVVPNTVTKFCIWAFEDCTNLQSINIPEGVTDIGDSCFKNCKVLDFPELPSTLVSIDDNAFDSACRTQKAKSQWISIPDSVVNVGSYAFAYTYFPEIELGRGVTNVGVFAFCDAYVTNLVFYGDCPAGDQMLDHTKNWKTGITKVTLYVTPSGRGWGTVPGYFRSYYVYYDKYLTRPIYYVCEHELDGGTYIETPTLYQGGEVVYKCKKCGRERKRMTLPPCTVTQDPNYTAAMAAFAPSTEAERAATSNLAAFVAYQGDASNMTAWVAKQSTGTKTLAARIAAARDPLADYVFNLSVGTFVEEPKLDIVSFDVADGFDVQVMDGDVALAIEKINATVSVYVSGSLDGLMDASNCTTPICTVNENGTLHVGAPATGGTCGFYTIVIKK